MNANTVIIEVNGSAEMAFEKCVLRWKGEDGTLDTPVEISAEKLHKFLGVKKCFSNWFIACVRAGNYDYGADEYAPLLNLETNRMDGYSLSLKMAREFTILSRSKKRYLALNQIRELQDGEDNREYLRRRKEAWMLLINPVARASFLDEEGYSGRQKNYDPSFFVDYGVNKEVFNESQARDQSIINELLFTKDVMVKLQGARH